MHIVPLEKEMKDPNTILPGIEALAGKYEWPMIRSYLHVSHQTTEGKQNKSHTLWQIETECADGVPWGMIMLIGMEGTLMFSNQLGQ